MAFLSREYMILSAFIAVVAIIMIIVPVISWQLAVAFVFGAGLSVLAGFIGMNISVRANVRTTQAATKSLAKALSVAFAGGSVTGLLVVGLALLAVAGYYGATGDIQGLVGLGFAASGQ